MSQSTNDIYLELRKFVRNPETTEFPKISSWTDYMVLANAQKDSDVLLYILNIQELYLSRQILLRENCYPLHSLASRNELSPVDLALIPKLLASRYFDITDLDSHHETVLQVALFWDNLPFIVALREYGVLAGAIQKLRERCGGHLTQAFPPTQQVPVSTSLIGLPEFIANEVEKVHLQDFVRNMNYRFCIDAHNITLCDRYVQAHVRYIGGEYCQVAIEHHCWVLVENRLKQNPEWVTESDQAFFIETIVKTRVPDRQRREVVSVLENFMKTDNLSWSYSCPLVESLILHEENQLKRHQLLNLCRPALTKMINEFVSSPLGRWLLLDEYQPTESEWASIEKAIYEDPENLPNYYLFTHAHGRFLYQCTRTKGKLLSVQGPDGQPMVEFDPEGQYFIELCQLPATLQTMKRGFVGGILREANEYPLFREALIASQFFRKTLLATIIFESNDDLFRYFLENHSKRFMKQVQNTLTLLGDREFSPEQIDKLSQPLLDGMNARASKSELKDEMWKLMQLFVRFSGEEKLQECVEKGDLHVPSEQLDEFFVQHPECHTQSQSQSWSIR